MDQNATSSPSASPNDGCLKSSFKQRIEYPGAIYHLISQNNYRKDLFTHDKSAESFERTIFEVAERCRWRLFAYMIMNNPYHLAMQPPAPNMVEGMRWLQRSRTKVSRLEGDDREAPTKETTAKHAWIAERLNMGHPNDVSNRVNQD